MSNKYVNYVFLNDILYQIDEYKDAHELWIKLNKLNENLSQTQKVEEFKEKSSLAQEREESKDE